MRFMLTLCVIIFYQCSDPAELKNAKDNTTKISLSEIVKENGIATQNLTFHVIKSDYLLHVEHADSILKSFPVVFGSNPIGQKLMEGDRKTPEGKFKIRDLYPHSKWSKFMWIDYPNEESIKNHKAAKSRGEIPADAAIGGEVGIHGVPAGYDNIISEKQNWTWGCISLTTKDVNELYSVCQVGTEILISK